MRRNSLLPSRISGRKSSSKHFKRRVRTYHFFHLIDFGNQESAPFNICGLLPVIIYLVRDMKGMIYQLASCIIFREFVHSPVGLALAPISNIRGHTAQDC